MQTVNINTHSSNYFCKVKETSCCITGFLSYQALQSNKMQEQLIYPVKQIKRLMQIAISRTLLNCYLALQACYVVQIAVSEPLLNCCVMQIAISDTAHSNKKEHTLFINS